MTRIKQRSSADFASVASARTLTDDSLAAVVFTLIDGSCQKHKAPFRDRKDASGSKTSRRITRGRKATRRRRPSHPTAQCKSQRELSATYRRSEDRCTHDRRGLRPSRKDW